MKDFNITGVCVPGLHYMVDIGGKLAEIVKLVEKGYYFVINRARQYGKTTVLFMLEKTLPSEYTCIRLSFEGEDDALFRDTTTFCQRFLRLAHKSLKNTDEVFANLWIDEGIIDFGMLGDHLHELCKDRKIVLMIDEVDATSNNRVFLQFLGMLRSKYLSRHEGNNYTFHSVILAGVTDIRNIKLKMVNDGIYEPAATEGKILNSPWNIATDFRVDMSFSPDEISTMLVDYEADYQTGMDVRAISEEIYDYTGGYPFLVSRVCLCIDKELDKEWTKTGVQEAVKIIIQERSTLFDDLTKNLANFKILNDFFYAMLVEGAQRSFMLYQDDIMLASMFGYIVRKDNKAVISNKIFEILLSDYYVFNNTKDSAMGRAVCGLVHSEIVRDGKFDMELCLRKFASHYRELYNEADKPFLERHGRLVFLSFLSPLINGHGFYHIESQFTDQRRMDVVVDYGSEQFIVELKRWSGEENRAKAFEQLLGYLEKKNAEKGYLLTFDFRKDENKERKAEWVKVGEKDIFEVVV